MSMQSVYLKNPNGFAVGFTPITQLNEQTNNTGMAFAILKLRAGEDHIINSPLETAIILLTGQIVLKFEGEIYEGQRDNIFEQDPHVLNVCQNTKIEIIAGTNCEIAVVQTENCEKFQPEIFNQDNMLGTEERGKGILKDTAYRIVRTVFDKSNRAQSNLVIGEVINFPGCWSSYPPHHHQQAEIYHYRFTEPQGYGHAECGEQIFRAENYATLKILESKDHAQVAAPGYGMYYLWLIRHLPDNPYTVPEFTKAHSWTKTDSANKRCWHGAHQ